MFAKYQPKADTPTQQTKAPPKRSASAWKEEAILFDDKVDNKKRENAAIQFGRVTDELKKLALKQAGIDQLLENTPTTTENFERNQSSILNTLLSNPWKVFEYMKDYMYLRFGEKPSDEATSLRAKLLQRAADDPVKLKQVVNTLNMTEVNFVTIAEYMLEFGTASKIRGLATYEHNKDNNTKIAQWMQAFAGELVELYDDQAKETGDPTKKNKKKPDPHEHFIYNFLKVIPRESFNKNTGLRGVFTIGTEKSPVTSNMATSQK